MVMGNHGAGMQFQSTLPAWGATMVIADKSALWWISIHAPRMGSDHRRARLQPSNIISIHAPRMGSDYTVNDDSISSRDFNPRSPHGERHKILGLFCLLFYFNPRSPHGERPFKLSWSKLPTISIHAPRMGSDIAALKHNAISLIFQSTLPAWGATVQSKHTAMTA